MATTAQASGTFKIGGDLEVTRLGYGAMRITGEGIWGPPRDRAAALAALRRLPDLGVDFIDTADSYGPAISEELIREALHPYEGMTVATKAGFTRTGPNEWHTLGRPDYLRQQLELSRQRLGIDRIDLWQLHRIDPGTPAQDQFALLRDAVDEGLVRHVGLSEVSVADIEAARAAVPIATVQNRYNLADRAAEDVLEYCEREGIGFIPWFPLAAGRLAQPGGAVSEIAAAHDASPGQVALAWLLQRSPVMLPIPGTGSVAHLEENVAAAGLQLTGDEIAQLDDASR
jgi:aryl-alcohol dehydrogenase-like predicted oxidoreductase